MRINIKVTSIILVVAFMLAACSTVPVTGRKQLNIIPDSQINSMSYQQYDEFLQTHKLSQDAAQTAMVKNIGVRIQRAVEEYFTANGMASQLNGYVWEFNLVEDSLVNAWCMPGGKVVVYTGLLPVTRDESGLAVVMGHEIAHAVANHGAERMSQGLMTQFGGMALAKAVEEKPEATQNLFMTAFGVTAQLGVLLPYSRLHESEADRLGLIFMAMAGYDPRLAVDFWQRMAADSGGAPPEFLSTHPSDDKRIADIQNNLPEALQYYRK